MLWEKAWTIELKIFKSQNSLTKQIFAEDLLELGSFLNTGIVNRTKKVFAFTDPKFYSVDSSHVHF